MDRLPADRKSPYDATIPEHFAGTQWNHPGDPGSFVRGVKENLMIVRQGACVLAILTTAGAMSASPARADAVSDFYTGKTVNLVIGYAPGRRLRSLCAHARTPHRPPHSRQPNIVVQNMPGAGSIKAANFLYTIAPKDGTTFGGFARGAVIDPLLGRGEGAQYDVRKFGWLGSISNEVGVCAFARA